MDTILIVSSSRWHNICLFSCYSGRFSFSFWIITVNINILIISKFIIAALNMFGNP